jgi:hypothetical protein
MGSGSRKSKINWGFILTGIGIVLILGAMHNIDILLNYVGIYNQHNIHECKTALNLGDVNDCGIFGCASFAKIYMSSMMFILIGLLILVGVIITLCEELRRSS